MLNKLKKTAAVMIMIASLIVGIIGIGTAEWNNPIGSIMAYLIVGVLPFFLGYLLFAGKKEFKESFWFIVRVFTGITILLPLTLQFAESLSDAKSEKVSSSRDIYLDSAGIPDWLAYLLIFAGIIAFFTFLGIYVMCFNVPKNVYYLFFISLILCIIIPLFTKDDYRAIRDDGLVLSIQGEYEEIPWTEIEHVFLNGYIDDGISRTDSPSYNWEFVFYTKDGEKEAFGPFGYSDYNLETSNDIKNKVREEWLSMSTEALSKEQWELVQLDMEFEEADRKDFYTLFQYDPETKDYYDLPLE